VLDSPFGFRHSSFLGAFVTRLISPIVLLFATAALAQTPPLSLHPDNPHYLLFRGKPTILVGSTEHYGAVMNLDFDYNKYLDELVAKNLNLTRTFSGTYHEVPGSFKITDNTLAPRRYAGPWARSDTPGAADGGDKFDLAKWNDAYFARLKDFVSQASKRGVVVEYVLFCPFYNEDLWTVNPMKAANNVNHVGQCDRTDVYTMKQPQLLAFQDAFVRKAVAELCEFDNVYFEICNEPYFGGVTLEWQAHIAATIADAEKDLPRKHLIAQNIANKGKKIENPNPLVSIFNFHYATPPQTVYDNYNLKAAFADDETGFRGKDDWLYRTEAWDFFLAGGAIYDNLDYSFTAAHPSGDFRDYKSPGGGSPELRSQLRIMRAFLEGFDLVHMKPDNTVIAASHFTGPPAGKMANSARALVQSGKAYAIYVLGGSKVELNLNLPAGAYKAQWLNTQTGKIDQAEDFQHAGGGRRLVSPAYDKDIALRIKTVER
jgi:hypothetical protein